MTGSCSLKIANIFHPLTTLTCSQLPCHELTTGTYLNEAKVQVLREITTQLVTFCAVLRGNIEENAK